MNKDIIQGHWTQLKGAILKSFGKITHDDLNIAEGNEEMLIGRLQERYGRAKEEARKHMEAETAEWKKTIRH